MSQEWVRLTVARDMGCLPLRWMRTAQGHERRFHAWLTNRRTGVSFAYDPYHRDLKRGQYTLFLADQSGEYTAQFSLEITLHSGDEVCVVYGWNEQMKRLRVRAVESEEFDRMGAHGRLHFDK